MKIKKLLATVLSAAMVVGSITIANVSTAFAAEDKEFTLYTKTKDAVESSKDGDDDYFTNVEGKANDIGNGATYTGSISSFSFTIGSNTSYTVPLVSSKYYAMKGNSGFGKKFTVVSGATAEIQVLWSPRGDKTALQGSDFTEYVPVAVAKSDGSATVTMSAADADAWYTNKDAVLVSNGSITEGGTYELTLVAGGKEIVIYGVRVIEHRPEGLNTYSISGSTSGLPDTSVSIAKEGQDPITVNVSSNTLSGTVSALTSPFENGDQVTVSANEYSVSPNPATVTVDGNNITLPNLTFEKLALDEIPAGSYAYNQLLLPNFERTGFDNGTAKPTGNTSNAGNMSVKLKLAKKANITINAKIDNSEKAGKIKVGDTVQALTGDWTAYDFTNVPKGDLTIVFGQSGDTGNVQINGNSPFITIEYVDSPEIAIRDALKEVEITAGETTTIIADVANIASLDDITSAASVDGVVAVDEVTSDSAAGTVTITLRGVAEGTADFTLTSVTDPTVTDSASITVNAAPVPKVEFTEDSKEVTVAADDKVTLTANVTLLEAGDLTAEADNDKVTVGSVTAGDTAGTVKVEVTGVKVGESTVTIKSKTDDTVADTATVTVELPDGFAPSVTVDPAAVELTDSVVTADVTAALTDFTEDAVISWESSDTNKATVSGTGKTATINKGTKLGTATVTVTVTETIYGQEFTETADVTVKVSSETTPYIELAKDKVTIYETQQIAVGILGKNVESATFDALSGNTSVATSTYQGDGLASGSAVITGVAAGSTDVTINENGTSNSFDNDGEKIAVTVKALPTVTIDAPESAEITAGAEPVEVTAAVEPSDAEITWSVPEAYKDKITLAPNGETVAVSASEAIEGEVDLTVSATAIVVSDAGEIGVTETKTVKLTVSAPVQTTISVTAPTEAVAAEVYETEADEVTLTAPQVTADPADASLEYVYTWTISDADAENIAFVGENAKTATGETVKIKGLKAAEGAKVTLTVTVKDTEIAAEPVQFTVNVTEKALPPVAADGTYVLETSLTKGEDGKYTVPDEGTFTVTVKTGKGFTANSITATLTYDSDVITLKGAETKSDLVKADALKGIDALSTVTVADFAFEGNDLKDVELADGAEVVVFTFEKNKGGSTAITFKNIQTANSSFQDVVAKNLEASIEVTAAEVPEVTETGKLHLLGDINLDGKVNANDAVKLITSLKEGKNVASYQYIADVNQTAAPDGSADGKVNANDAVLIITTLKAGKKLSRPISNDVVIVEDKAYVKIPAELAEEILTANPNLPSGVIIDEPAAKA